jgi:signal peptidase II
MARENIGWRVAYLVAAAGIYLTDQASKAWAARSLRFGDATNVIPGFLNFIYAENTGVAFSQFQDKGALGRWILAGLATAAAVGVLIYFLKTPRNEDKVLGACALLLAGICGNLTDRVRLGFVIDFIDVHIKSFHWPTFNVADASICFGAVLLAYDVFFSKNKQSVVSDQQSVVENEEVNSK